MRQVCVGFARGVQALEDDTEIFYQISEFCAPKHARGVRWNDPLSGISWPVDQRAILERDLRYLDFRPAGIGAP